MSDKKTDEGCTVCFDCGWVINDDLKTPFYDLTFRNLMPGDELIRCWECNSVDLKPVTQQRKPKKQGNIRYKTH